MKPVINKVNKRVKKRVIMIVKKRVKKVKIISEVLLFFIFLQGLRNISALTFQANNLWILSNNMKSLIQVLKFIHGELFLALDFWERVSKFNFACFLFLCYP